MGRSNAIAFGLRLSSAVAKFLLVTYLGFRDHETLLGELALFVAITTIFTQVAGLELNQVIGRRLQSLSRHERNRLLNFHALASGIVYLLAVPTIYFFYWELLELYWVIGIPILILEHYVTEIYRLNILDLKPVRASVVLFLKNVGWVALFIALIEIGGWNPAMELILVCWLFFLVCAVIASVFLNGMPQPDACSFHFRKSIRGVAELVWSAKTFVVSATAIAGIGAIDKLIIAHYFSLDELGVFYLFQTIATIPAIIVSFSIGATIWPKCIKYAALGQEAECKRIWNELNRLFVVVTIVLSTALALVVMFSLNISIVDRYQQDYLVFILLLGASAFFVMCDPYKLKLYIQRKDRILLIANVAQFSIVALFVLIGAQQKEMEFLTGSICAANFVALISFRYFTSRVSNSSMRLTK